MRSLLSKDSDTKMEIQANNMIDNMTPLLTKWQPDSKNLKKYLDTRLISSSDGLSTENSGDKMVSRQNTVTSHQQ
jgi:hypothetical protein